ncbi:MAG: TonB family protein, partial [Acidobacteria bacterium]|nr:TonB family protein [Acidobacteriota bacterium]
MAFVKQGLTESNRHPVFGLATESMMNQPERFGQFLLFQRSESNTYRSCYRAGVTKGRAIERIVWLEIFDQPDIEPDDLVRSLDSSADRQNKLEDPHIAIGAGLGQVGGIPYAAYDFELGTTLAAFLTAAREQSFPVPFDQALFIAERVALALAAAYRVEDNDGPVLHSFLTPDSVLLSNEGEVKVCGFGIGRALHDQLADKPFCASYISPQCRSGQPPIARDDVFSLGSLLFELVTGQPLAVESMDLGRLIVQATGEPGPESLRLLLEASFAPPAIRISNVLDWQQRLARLILDGEYNPTTFNLSFLLHTLLRDSLERGSADLKQEKRFVLPARDTGSTGEVTAEVSTVASPILAGSEPLDGEPVSAAADLETPTLSRAGQTRQAEVDAADRKPFWLGFSISGVTASALMGAFLVFGGDFEDTPASPLAATASAATGLPKLAPELIVPVVPVGPTTPVTSRVAEIAQPPAETPWVVLTDVVNGGLSRTLDEQEIQRAVAERAGEIERSLKAEYERQLENLRSQIIDTKRREIDAERVSTPMNQDAGSTETVGAAGAAKNGAEPTGSSGAGAAAGATTQRSSAVPATPQRELPKSEPPPEPARKVSTENEVRAEAPATSTTLATTTQLDAVEDLPSAAETAGAAVTAADLSGEVDTPAQLLRLNPPSYPAAARRLRLSATARVKVLISIRGKVREAQIVGPPLGSGFDRAALAAVRRSR